MDAFIYVLTERMEMLESRLNQAFKTVNISRHEIHVLNCGGCDITYIYDEDFVRICDACEESNWCDVCREDLKRCDKCELMYCDDCIDSKFRGAVPIVRVDDQWLCKRCVEK